MAVVTTVDPESLGIDAGRLGDAETVLNRGLALAPEILQRFSGTNRPNPIFSCTASGASPPPRTACPPKRQRREGGPYLLHGGTILFMRA